METSSHLLKKNVEAGTRAGACFNMCVCVFMSMYMRVGVRVDKEVCYFLEYILQSASAKKEEYTEQQPLQKVLFWYVEDHPECRSLSKCPKPLGKEWRRLQKLCCPDYTGVLHCQLDDEDKINMMCIDPPVLCPPGKFNILNIYRSLLQTKRSNV